MRLKFLSERWIQKPPARTISNMAGATDIQAKMAPNWQARPMLEWGGSAPTLWPSSCLIRPFRQPPSLTAHDDCRNEMSMRALSMYNFTSERSMIVD